MSRLRRLWWVLPAVLVVVVVAFVLWASAAAAPMPEALAALRSDAQVTAETDPWLVFQPRDREPATGLVLYPGARVDPRAYAPAAKAIAEEGYLVAIAPMPLNLAFFAPGRAAEVMTAFPGIEHWAVGGHSLGGAMAANFAHGNSAAGNAGAVQGLVLWAAYPAGGDDLSDAQLAVASIYGTQDGLATAEEIEASRALLPPDTQWTAIEGGNHAQFGWYGPQSGDNEATIGRDEQQARVVTATVQLLRTLEE
jgi:pimeloyl-ACP methyl ester carboxylesterase